jgi:hypothetical protein
MTIPLPDYFPLKTKKCRLVADSFFTCFEDSGIVSSGSNTTNTGIVVSSSSTTRGKCDELLNEYKKCMDRL